MHVQINNGVYRSGFATTQGAYERAQNDLYIALDTVEQRLSQHRFLIGDRSAALRSSWPLYAASPRSCDAHPGSCLATALYPLQNTRSTAAQMTSLCAVL